jgi:hypothetical protein
VDPLIQFILSTLDSHGRLICSKDNGLFEDQRSTVVQAILDEVTQWECHADLNSLIRGLVDLRDAELEAPSKLTGAPLMVKKGKGRKPLKGASLSKEEEKLLRIARVQRKIEVLDKIDAQKKLKQLKEESGSNRNEKANVSKQHTKVYYAEMLFYYLAFFASIVAVTLAAFPELAEDILGAPL